MGQWHSMRRRVPAASTRQSTSDDQPQTRCYAIYASLAGNRAQNKEGTQLRDCRAGLRGDRRALPLAGEQRGCLQVVQILPSSSMRAQAVSGSATFRSRQYIKRPLNESASDAYADAALLVPAAASEAPNCTQRAVKDCSPHAFDLCTVSELGW